MSLPNTPNLSIPKIIIALSPPLEFTESLIFYYNKTSRYAILLLYFPLFKHIDRLDIDIQVYDDAKMLLLFL
jgi:hypothetical protein